MKLNPIHSQNAFFGEIHDLYKENEQLRRENATLKEWLTIQGISSPLSLTAEGGESSAVLGSPQVEQLANPKGQPHAPDVTSGERLTLDLPDYDRSNNPSESQIYLVSDQFSDQDNLNLFNKNQDQYHCRPEKISIESKPNHWQSSVASNFLQKRTLALEYLIRKQAQSTDNLNDAIQGITEIGTQTLETVQSISVWLDLKKNSHLEEYIRPIPNHPIKQQHERYLCLLVSTRNTLELIDQSLHSLNSYEFLDIPIQNLEGEIGFLRVKINDLSASWSEEEQSFLECLANLVSMAIEQEKFRNQEKKLKARFQQETAQLNTSDRKRRSQTAAKNTTQITSSANRSLLTHISHELRTPIHAIVGYSDLLCEEMLEQGQVNWLQDIQTIRKKGYQLLQIVESILDLVRIESKQISLNLELFDPIQIIQGVVEDLVPIAEKNHNQLKIQYGHNLGLMHTDLSKLQKILHHLLKNALKFTEGSQFKLTIRRQGNWIDFDLTNTKIGNTTQQQQYLLEAFTQASELLSCKSSRTELGLTICRSLCEIMGGEMKVSRCYNQGLTFTVRLQAQLEEVVSY